MIKSDIGLKLISLYRDITKPHHSNDTGNTSNCLVGAGTSKVEGMTIAILSALDNRNFDKAYTLLNDWVMNYPLENEGSVLYNYLRVEYHLRLLDCEEDTARMADNLNDAIDAADDFFMANMDEGNVMDDMTEELSARLKTIIELLRQDKKQIFPGS